MNKWSCINNNKKVLNKFKQNNVGLDAIVFMEYRKPLNILAKQK